MDLWKYRQRMADMDNKLDNNEMQRYRAGLYALLSFLF